MARQTKSERAAQRAVEQLDYERMMKAAYPLRLMKLLERVTVASGFDIDVMNLTFRITGPDRQQTWNLSYDYTDCVIDMEELEYVLLPKVTVGCVDFLNTGAAIADLKRSSVIACLNVDGIIGANLMQKAIWQIDYEK